MKVGVKFRDRSELDGYLFTYKKNEPIYKYFSVYRIHPNENILCRHDFAVCAAGKASHETVI